MPPEPAPPTAFCLRLDEGWRLQSSAATTEGGDRLSRPGADVTGWYEVTVPTTVLAGLVKNDLYPDPFHGMNLRQIPGTGYPIGRNFSNLPMPTDSPFAVPWWYRRAFTLPATVEGQRLWLHFGGINYRAAVWLNGRRLDRPGALTGAYRSYSLDMTGTAIPGGENVLAVQVQAPREDDLAITFVDWNPLPPDKVMGLWREVTVTATGPVALRHPMVTTALIADGADLTVRARVTNASQSPIVVTIAGHIEARVFSQEVALSAGEEREIAFTPDDHPGLRLTNPRLWWPAQMGEPHLHELTLEAHVAGALSDRSVSRFGIRTIDSQLTPAGHRLFTVNGTRILIRGAGWASDLMLRYDPARVEDQLRYALDMGLNTIRLEGKLEPDHFFDVADRLGLLVMAGWCCCDHWEKWQSWKPEDPAVAASSLRDQLLRLRGHPCLLAWLNGSDAPPPPEIERLYLNVADEVAWPTPRLSSATARPSPISGPSGVKMTGPYDYVAPAYWMTDVDTGGAHGFNTETSPGPAVPPIESLRRMLPAEHLWPIDEVWNYHAGGGAFAQLDAFTAALEARLGKATSAEDYARKAQVLAYEGVRAMFEAYSRNKYVATGVIQWMLNNAWPGLIWHLFDHDLLPGGAYFGAKKGCQSLHPLYSYDDGSIWVVNSRYVAAGGLVCQAQLFDFEARARWSQEASLDLEPDGVCKVFSLPHGPPPAPLSFLRLTLRDRTGALVGSNFYWLSAKPEIIDWAQANQRHTPTLSFADFTALSTLPRARLDVHSRTEYRGDQAITQVILSNSGDALAFFVRLQVCPHPAGDEGRPVLWRDNYVSLLPGETQSLTATYRTPAGADPVVIVSGYNVERTTCTSPVTVTSS